jgi:hypothetical protein
VSGAEAAGVDRCPRCAGGFHCGVNDTAPCPCASLTLTPELQAALRQRYHGCLCLNCLRALAAGASIDPPSPTV